MPKRSVALVDFFVVGHQLTYQRLYAQTLLELGYDVTVMAPDAAALESLRHWVAATLPSREASFRAVLLPTAPQRHLLPKVDAVLNVARRWRAVGRALADGAGRAPDFVFFMCFEHLRPWLNLRASSWIMRRYLKAAWGTLCFTPSGVIEPSAPVRRVEQSARTALLAGDVQVLGTLDEEAMPALMRVAPAAQVARFPDLADESAPAADDPLAREVVRRAAGRPVVSLLGLVAKRKGILTLLDVIESTPPETCFFLIAGTIEGHSFTPAEAARIEAFRAVKRENCLTHFETVPDGAPFNALVVASSLLYVVYEKFTGSSNLLTKAAVFRRPVLGPAGTLMGRRIERFGIGATVPEGDARACRDALVDGLARRTFENAAFAAYAADHSRAKLQEVWRTLLASVERDAVSL